MNKGVIAVAVITAWGCAISLHASKSWADEDSVSYQKLVNEVKAFDKKQRTSIESLVKACYDLMAATELVTSCKAEVNGWLSLYGGLKADSVVEHQVKVLQIGLQMYTTGKSLGVADVGIQGLKEAEKRVEGLRSALRDTETKGFFSSFFK